MYGLMGVDDVAKIAQETQARLAFRLAYRVDMTEHEKLELWRQYAPILHNPGDGPEDE